MFFLRTNPLKLPERPKRILLIHFGSVGDVIQGIPLLTALRMRFPHAELGWLLEESTAPILKGHPALNRILIAKKRWNHSSLRVQFLRNRLRLFDPDITIDLQGSVRSTSAAWISGAKYRIGFVSADLKKEKRFLNNIRISPNNAVSDDEHFVDRNLRIMEQFGVDGCSVAFDLHEDEISRCRANEILGRIGLHENFAILNPVANTASLSWPGDRFANLAKHLKNHWNLPSLVIWDDDEERTIAESIVHSADGSAILSPYATLSELAAIVRSATVLVSADASVLHIAAAVATPCLGLFGGASALKYGPYGLRNHAIQAHSSQSARSSILSFPSFLEKSSSASVKSKERNREFLMDMIETSMVCEVCDEMLNEILHGKSGEFGADAIQHRMVLHSMDSQSDQRQTTIKTPKAA